MEIKITFCFQTISYWKELANYAGQMLTCGNTSDTHQTDTGLSKTGGPLLHSLAPRKLETLKTGCLLLIVFLLFSKTVNTTLMFISLLSCFYWEVTTVDKPHPVTTAVILWPMVLIPLRLSNNKRTIKHVIFTIFSRDEWLTCVHYQLVVAIFPPGREGSSSPPQCFKDAAVFGGRAQYELMTCAGDVCVCVCLRGF